MDRHSRRGKRVRRLAGGLSGLAVLAAVAFLSACSGSAVETPSDVFGPPPPASPGVHAWAAGEVGELFVTEDGGATWGRQRFYLPQRGVEVAFSDADTGWLVTDAGTVLATTDGGVHWTVVKQIDLAVKALAAHGAACAWVVGHGAGETGGVGASVVLRTADGGSTWQRRGFGIFPALVDMPGEGHGVLVALDRVWSTRDGGETWQRRRTLPMTVLTSVAMADPRHAWVAGWDTLTGAPLILATRDGGKTWRSLEAAAAQTEPGDLQARQIAAAGPDRLWVTCAAGVLATRDGGRNWELQAVPAGRPLAVAAADETHVLATTEGQPILATADGGTAWLAFGHDGLLTHPLVCITAVVAPSAEQAE